MRAPRHLHPGAWWLWASALALAASRTTNPVLLIVVVAVCGFVVSARRPATPWNSSYGVFLKLGLIAVALRVALFALLGASPGGHVVVRLPEMPLPDWLAGVRLGGPVTAEGLAAAAYDGLRLAVVLVCVGAANALTSPRRLLKSLPGALYEAGVVVTVALSFAPQAVAAVGRVRAARRLRGHTDRGLRALRALGVPVLEGALERSVDLAAAMDARGFGRRGNVPVARRRLTAALTVAGLVALIASTYGLTDAEAPSALGLPLLVAGAVATAVAFALGAGRGGRTRYRADPWRTAEWAVAACGALAVLALAATPDAALAPSTSPLLWPQVPALALLGMLAAALPAGLAPPLPVPRRRAAASGESRRPREPVGAGAAS